VLRAKHARLLRMAQEEPAAVRAALDLADNSTFEVTEGLEAIARIVAKLPEVPFTVDQRQMGQMIAREIHTRARSPEASRHEGFYAHSKQQEIETRYAAIAEAAADPKLRLRDIATEYGVTTQLVSRIAIARGHRRRTRHG
jgi:hypothetical protein